MAGRASGPGRARAPLPTGAAPLLAVLTHRHRLERQLRMALGVEEVGGEQVWVEVLVLDVEARDVDAALDRQRAVVAAQLHVVVVELAAEAPDGHVTDGKAD